MLLPEGCAAAVSSPPDLAGFEVDGKDAIGIEALQGEEPFLQTALASAVGEQCHAFGNFSSGNDAEKKIFAVEIFHCAPDVRWHQRRSYRTRDGPRT